MVGMCNDSWINQLKYRWFNIHPSSNAIAITNNDGLVFWICLEEKRPNNIYIGKNARNCGVIRLIWDEAHLELCDIYLRPKYRGKNLGTKLLQWLIFYTKKESIKRIEAMVVPEEGKDFSRLMSWYLRQGFYRDTVGHKSIIMDL